MNVVCSEVAKSNSQVIVCGNELTLQKVTHKSMKSSTHDRDINCQCHNVKPIKYWILFACHHVHDTRGKVIFRSSSHRSHLKWTRSSLTLTILCSLLCSLRSETHMVTTNLATPGFNLKLLGLTYDI